MADKDKKIYVFDFETDPFKSWADPSEQRVPQPFCVGVFDGHVYEHFWGEPEEVIGFLLSVFEAAPSGSIFFAHNGGKFDFHYLKDFMRGEIKIIGGRIARCQIGNVELRDSFALIPVGLDKYQKTKIEYWKFEPDVREEHKAEILAYLKTDCVYLFELVQAFIDEFGLSLTMASAAMKQMKKFHEFERLASKAADDKFREYYFGGRVECIESGILEGNWKIYDVNSMYPAVMRNFLHPVSRDVISYTGKHLANSLEHCDFARIRARNDGALPSWREDGHGLTFRKPHGEFFATGHEIRAGIETGTLKIEKVFESYRATERITFEAFIDHFFNARLKAKADGNELLDLFYKLVMNSSYGKFAQNPEKFKDWLLTEEMQNTSEGWNLEHIFPDNILRIWSRPSALPEYLSRFNVMTAASVTGAARAQLLRGLNACVRPVYCDTDSIICEHFAGDIDAKRLGAWKMEAEGVRLAIGGKKMYVLKDAENNVVKKASKGVRISEGEIETVAGGGTVVHRNQAPTFSLVKKTKFIERKIKRTVRS